MLDGKRMAVDEAGYVSVPGVVLGANARIHAENPAGPVISIISDTHLQVLEAYETVPCYDNETHRVYRIIRVLLEWELPNSHKPASQEYINGRCCK
ncbi:MAG: hypothetical protein KGL39_54225 [Patescibacteria group bacterium]|nr:hypothetical protein [Patescibacteria group bacterium]